MSEEITKTIILSLRTVARYIHDASAEDPIDYESIKKMLKDGQIASLVTLLEELAPTNSKSGKTSESDPLITKELGQYDIADVVSIFRKSLLYPIVLESLKDRFRQTMPRPSEKAKDGKAKKNAKARILPSKFNALRKETLVEVFRSDISDQYKAAFTAKESASLVAFNKMAEAEFESFSDINDSAILFSFLTFISKTSKKNREIVLSVTAEKVRLEKGDDEQPEKKKSKKRSDCDRKDGKKNKKKASSPARSSSSKGEKKKESRKRASEEEKKTVKSNKKQRIVIDDGDDSSPVIEASKVHAKPASQSGKRPGGDGKESKEVLIPAPRDSKSKKAPIYGPKIIWKESKLFPGYSCWVTQDANNHIYVLLSKDNGATIERVHINTEGFLTCGPFIVEISIANRRVNRGEVKNIIATDPLTNVIFFDGVDVNENCIFGDMRLFNKTRNGSDDESEEETDDEYPSTNKEVKKFLETYTDIEDPETSNVSGVLNFKDGTLTVFFDSNIQVGKFDVRMKISEKKPEALQEALQDGPWFASPAIHPSIGKTECSYRLEQKTDNCIELATLVDGSMSRVHITKNDHLMLNGSVATIYLSCFAAFESGTTAKFAVPNPLKSVFGFVHDSTVPIAPMVSDDQHAIQGVFDSKNLSNESLAFFSRVGVDHAQTDGLVLESKLDFSSGMYEINQSTPDGTSTVLAALHFRIKVE